MIIQDTECVINELKNIGDALNTTNITNDIIDGVKYKFIDYGDVVDMLKYMKDSNISFKKQIILDTYVKCKVEKERCIIAYYNYNSISNGIIKYIADLEDYTGGVGLKEVKEFIEQYIVRSKMTDSEYFILDFSEHEVAEIITSIKILNYFKNRISFIGFNKLMKSRKVADLDTKIKKLANKINGIVQKDNNIGYVISNYSDIEDTQEIYNNVTEDIIRQEKDEEVHINNNDRTEEIERDEIKTSLLVMKNRINKGNLKPETEEATKQWFILPLFEALGYNIYSNDIIPEFSLDVGIKKGERVDYILQSNNRKVMIVECKQMGRRLSNNDISQLYRYFTVSDLHIAILTNGDDYWFFTDSVKENIMDLEPYYRVKLSTINITDIDKLRQYSKENITSINMEEIVKSELSSKR